MLQKRGKIIKCSVIAEPKNLYITLNNEIIIFPRNRRVAIACVRHKEQNPSSELEGVGGERMC